MPHPDHAIARLALAVFADLDALRSCPGPGLPRRGIDLSVTRRRGRHLKAITGLATWAYKGARRRKGGAIRLRLTPKTDRASILVLTLHEAVHLALPASENHGPLFRRTLAAAAEEAWNIDLSDDLDWDGDGEGYEGLHEAIAHRLLWRTLRLKVALWSVRARRRVGLLPPDRGVDVAPGEHLLVGEIGG